MFPYRHILAVFLLAAIPVHAQQLLYRQFVFNEGLRNGTVNQVMQDSQGYIWAATDGGIHGFNGQNFEMYLPAPGWPADAAILQLCESDNQLYIIREDTCLVHISHFRSRYRQVHALPEIAHPLSMATFGDALYVLTSGYVWEIKGHVIARKFDIRQFNPNLRPLSIQAWKDQLLMNTENAGVVRIETATGMLVPWRKLTGNTNPHVIRHLVMPNGDMYLGHPGSISYFAMSGEIVHIPLHNYEAEWGPGTVTDLAGDTYGQTWVATNQGVYLLYRDKIIGWYSDDNNSFMTWDFRSIFCDHEGNQWLGTTGAGIVMLKHSAYTRLSKSFQTYDPCYAVLPDENGTYWMGYFGEHFIIRAKQHEGLLVYDTLALDGDAFNACKDPVTQMLCFAGDQQFTLVDHGELKERSAEGFSGPMLRNPFFSRVDSCIYICSDNGCTRYRKGMLQPLYADGDAPLQVVEGASTRSTNYLATQDGLYITQKNGLVRWVGSNGKWRITEPLVHIASDARDEVWICTRSSRIWHIADKNADEQVACFDAGNWLGEAGPYAIAVHDTLFFLRTFNYLYFLDERTINRQPHVYARLDNYDGLHPESPELFFMHAENGMLYCAGAGGAMRYDLRKLAANTSAPQVHLQRMEVDGISTGLDTYCSGWDTLHDDLPLNLSLPHYLNNIRFSFTAFSFTSPEEIRYQAFLQGWDDHWSAPFAEPHIAYTHIAPGTYTLLLRACNADGYWNTEPYRFTFTIRPAWHQTWWFRGLMLCCMAGLIYLGFRIRINQLKRKQKLQEKLTQDILQSQETERKRIAQELHDGVGQELSLLKITAEKQQQEQITQRVKKVIEDIRLISRNLHPHYFEKLGLSRAIEVLVEEAHQSGPIYWVHELETIDALFSASQQLMIFRMVQECVNNTLKHSQAKNAKVSIHREGAAVQIMVQDNGRGFQPDQQKLQSLGLSTIRERVKALGGEFILRSKPGQGTQYIITLPVNV